MARIHEQSYLWVVHRLVPGIAVLLAYAITPGAGEMTENVAHFLRDGHAAHAPHDAGHAPNEDAHGCSGPFQTCPCHGTSAFVTDHGPFEIGEAEIEPQMLRWFVAVLQGDGVFANVFRPPIA